MKSIAHKALRPIAAIEALKGVIVLIAGLGLLGFLDRNNEVFAEQIIRHLHLDPAQQYANRFIMTMAQQNDSQLMAWAGFAALYSALRFTEAYGLWFERRWAEWLAALSGGVYVPIELYEIFRRATWLKFGALVINLVIVGYMVWLLSEARRKRAAAEKKLTAAVG